MLSTPAYVGTIEYSVCAQSEAMSGIYVKKGLLTRNIKHVPFRTIHEHIKRCRSLRQVVWIRLGTYRDRR
ncbi:MAG: hypothetical protein ACOC6N_04490 [archaeon]